MMTRKASSPVLPASGARTVCMSPAGRGRDCGSASPPLESSNSVSRAHLCLQVQRTFPPHFTQKVPLRLRSLATCQLCPGLPFPSQPTPGHTRCAGVLARSDGGKGGRKIASPVTSPGSPVDFAIRHRADVPPVQL